MTSWKNNNTLESRRLVEEVLDSPKKTRKVVARDLNHLKWLIKERTHKFGYRCDLNDIDVSRVTYMSELFKNSRFNGDISNWDVSNVRNMQDMFAYSSFNGDISKWDVSKVESLDGIFMGSEFHGDVSSLRGSKAWSKSAMIAKASAAHA